VDAAQSTSNPSVDGVGHTDTRPDSPHGAQTREGDARAVAAPTDAAVPARRRSHRVSSRVALGVALVAVCGAVWVASEHASGSPSAARANAPTRARHHHGGSTISAQTAVAGGYGLEAGVRYESYQRPDPTLPGVPAGRVKRFRVDVLMHETKVAAGKPPLRVWSFGVNGRFMRGTGVLPPIVVEEGDRVEVTFVNGADASMGVDMPHSLDIHAAEVAPDRAFKTVPPGATTRYGFVARTPGVYM
jgi:hypothetical protein